MKLLILSDIHGNWPALEAVIHAEPVFDAVAFCGDVVDYGPCLVECIRWLAYNADHLVRGNYDNALAFDLDCRCMGSFREYSLATRAGTARSSARPTASSCGRCRRSTGSSGKGGTAGWPTRPRRATCSSTSRWSSGKSGFRG